MRTYVARRILLLIPVVIMVAIIAFLLLNIAPGDAAATILEQQLEGGMASPEETAALREQLGLDKPIHVRFWNWISGVFRGDLGNSLIDTRFTVNDKIGQAFPISLQIMVMAVLFGIVIGVPVGIVSAVWQGTWADYVGRFISILGLSVPNFFLGILALYFLSVYAEWTKPFGFVGFFEDPWMNLQQTWLPMVAIGLRLGAIVMRMLRSTMLEVIRADYVRTARAKGLSERLVISRHVLKNALIPVVTLMGIQVGVLMGGSAIVETLFTLPGLGQLIVTGIAGRDYPVVLGGVMIIATAFLLINVLVDISYAWLDPRIRYS